MSKWNLSSASSKLNGEGELRAHENRTVQFQMINGQLVGNARSSNAGLSARIFQKGAWGFASVPEISASATDRVLKQAGTNASTLSKHVALFDRPMALANARGNKDYTTKNRKLSSQDIIQFMNGLDAKMKAKFPDLKSRTLMVYEQDFEKEVLTTGGALCYSMLARSYVRVYMSLDSDNGPVDVQQIFGGIGQIEDNLPSETEVDRKLEEAYRHLKNKAKGVAPQAGMKEVIMDSKLAGILAHEAIGHTTEADLVMGGSVAGDYLGQQVASPLVTLVDFAHTALNQACPLPVFFDDEGIEAQDTVIIENGVLKNYMHSRESAARFGHKATGHARAWG